MDNNFTFYSKKVGICILSFFNKKNILFLLFNLLIIQFSFGQTDYRSRFNGPRDWDVSTSWQTSFDNRSTWSNASTYPGENAGSYNVTIQSGHTIEVPTNLTTLAMGEVFVNGTLNLIGGSKPKTIILETEDLTISGGILNFDSQKMDLYLPANSVIVVENNGDITGGCSNNTEIFIGNKLIAVCQGGGNSGVLTFGEIVTGGGTLNAIISTPDTNPFTSTINQLITLVGSYSGSTSETVTYEWFVQDPDEIVTSFSTSSLTSYTPTKIGNYLFSFVVSTQVSGSPFSNSETLTVYSSQYFNSDDDTVFNNIDIDDDNDGILDTEECPDFVKPRFLNADFEDLNIIDTGLDGGVTDVVGTSGIWKGHEDEIPNWESSDPTNNHLEIWHNTQAAGNDAGGQAFSGIQWAEINATTNDGFYQDITTTPGDILQWSFAHRKRTGYIGSANEDIARLLIGDPNGTLSSQGDFSSAGDASWTEHSGTYIVPAGQTTTRLTFTAIQVASGGGTSSGNFVDKVQLYVIPNCLDTDGDSIPDYFDLDSDNDGIPDVVEAGLANLSDGRGKISEVNFSDTNVNGMHETAESNTPLDSDGDGVPNYIDLDSDNDGIFDVDESGVTSSSAPISLQNGDGDINGDGTGDGSDSETFRLKDSDDNGIFETFGDGILDIYDYGTGSNEYGNLNQGTAPLYVKDTDGDGIPDYIDITSNGSTFDITTTLYSSFDADSNGIIDGSTDTDGDGILDTFDTDNTVFGSPRDLNRKLHLFFDGRNDYVEDDATVIEGNEASIMGWVKIDPAATGDQLLLGQNKFYLLLKSNKFLEATANGNTIISTAALTTNQWIHVAASFNTSGTLKLYINGAEIVTNTTSPASLTDASLFTIGKTPGASTNYYHGYFDEVKVFNKALTENELRKMIYQEIENNSNIVKGSIIPIDLSNFVSTADNTPLAWSSLKRYFRMDTYKDDIIDDLSTAAVDIGIGAKIYNTKLIDNQSAPLPFITQIGDTTLSNAVNIASEGVNGNDVNTYDWSIVKIEHKNISCSSNQSHLALFVNSIDANTNPIELSIKNDSELNISWYLKLDGFIDLEGESQLVQGEESVLDNTSTGYIERDQQGEGNKYRYNDWCSPVIKTNTSSSTPFTIADVLKDGTNPTMPGPIIFNDVSYDGKTSPMTLSTYWMYKYVDSPYGDYSSWLQIRSTGDLSPGEGFLMKGTGSAPDQNYVFVGKPNNGEITLSVAPDYGYLVGNPYPSSLDADQFILDNANSITGTLYYWDHYGGDSHYIAEYQAGYATYNMSGGIAPASPHPMVDQTAPSSPKTPEAFIAVAQGFFVQGDADGGDIIFNNSQRIFKRESLGESVFMKGPKSKTATVRNVTNQDKRQKIRLGFDAPKIDHRQLLLTIDERATDNVDYGFDGEIYEQFNDDMFWMIENKKYVIQGINELNLDKEIPIGIQTIEGGTVTIKIDQLENFDENSDLYIKDLQSGETYEITHNSFEIYLEAGEYFDRFVLTFQPRLKTIEEIELFEGISITMNNSTEELQLKKIIDVEIENIYLFNILGQKIKEWNSNLIGRMISLPINSDAGAYIVYIKTSEGYISKKIIKA